MAIIDLFDRGWNLNPRGAAYIAGERTWSFDEAGAMSCRIARALLRDGFARETKCAVLAANDPLAWICVLGAWRARLAFVPLNPRAVPDETLSILDEFDCEVLFFQHAFAPMIDTIRPRLSKLKTLVCIDGAHADVVPLNEWIKDCGSERVQVDVDMDDVVAVSPTGGTTGAPKGVMNTHRSFQTAIAHLMISNSYGANETPVNLAAAPMTHSAGLLSLPATARGGTVVVLTRPDPVALIRAIERHKVTEFFLPPTIIYALLQIPGIEKHNYSSLKYLMYGAAPMSVEKLKRAIHAFGPVMTGGYGQSEAPLAISTLRPAEHMSGAELAADERLASVGVVGPFCAIAILDEANAPVAAHEVGEISVRGDLVMKGYYKAPEQTAETIVDGWLHTGDLGYLDGDGFLHITDRKKDMIISGGFNVFPSEIEQVIWQHPAVEDCAVIGLPDEKWGETVTAVVQLNPSQSVSENELIELCRARLGGVKTPKSVRFVEQLPRSTAGKVLKKDLRFALRG